MNRSSAFVSFIFVSGFVSTSFAPLAMNLAMSSGSALPVTADKANHVTRQQHDKLYNRKTRPTDDGAGVLNVFSHDHRSLGTVHADLITTHLTITAKHTVYSYYNVASRTIT